MVGPQHNVLCMHLNHGPCDEIVIHIDPELPSATWDGEWLVKHKQWVNNVEEVSFPLGLY
jgi:hypothetical protein